MRKNPLEIEQGKSPIEQWEDAIVVGLKMNAEEEKSFRIACAVYDAEKEKIQLTEK
jgi:hypothetical protein